MFSVCQTDIRSRFFSDFLRIVSILLMRFDVSDVTQGAREVRCFVFLGMCFSIMLNSQV